MLKTNKVSKLTKLKSEAPKCVHSYILVFSAIIMQFQAPEFSFEGVSSSFWSAKQKEAPPLTSFF